ncbi:hypothetical protein BZL30_7738 [Mycobacterium kansasii]|uniref:Uncharacterized protein n=1 Tax=Mycobacterium kansasii TaxID=1768 RepID=A0A1V3WL26_MYCKA|nr:hypothetical protein BZL30_7738 [Mycobacterium kansasii]
MNHYQQLPASGDVEPATLDFVDLPEPLELDAGVECLGGYAICPLSTRNQGAQLLYC